MISQTFVQIAIIGSCLLIAAIWLPKIIRRHTTAVPVEQEPEVLDLSCPVTRGRLQTVLTRYHITGSADIRDGKVHVPIDLENRLHPVATLMSNAAAITQRLKNPASCSLYVRDSVGDRWMLVPDLDLDDLREAAELLRAAVAERIARKAQ